jgi:hypothetical protein
MAQQQLSEAYKRDLLGQIQAHREATLAERQAFLEEGKRIKQQQMTEKATLEMVSTRNSFYVGYDTAAGLNSQPNNTARTDTQTCCHIDRELHVLHLVDTVPMVLHVDMFVFAADQGTETARAGGIWSARKVHS